MKISELQKKLNIKDRPCEDERSFLPLASTGDYVCLDRPPHVGPLMLKSVQTIMIEQIYCKIPLKYHNNVIWGMFNPDPTSTLEIEQVGYVYWFYVPD